MGETFTLTVNVEKATTVDFIIKVCSTNGYSFSYTDAFTSVSLNGSEVVRNIGTVNTHGWYAADASDISIAKLNLRAGENVITFTAGTGTSKTLNVIAVSFDSTVPVFLGKNE